MRYTGSEEKFRGILMKKHALRPLTSHISQVQNEREIQITRNIYLR